MTGLRTQEKNEFLNFFSIVQNSAHLKNSVFFLDTGEGHSFQNKNMIGMDLSGWLIPKSLSKEFENEYKHRNDLDKWDDYYKFAEWSSNADEIKISFVKY